MSRVLFESGVVFERIERCNVEVQNTSSSWASQLARLSVLVYSPIDKMNKSSCESFEYAAPQKIPGDVIMHTGVVVSSSGNRYR